MAEIVRDEVPDRKASGSGLSSRGDFFVGGVQGRENPCWMTGGGCEGE